MNVVLSSLDSWVPLISIHRTHNSLYATDTQQWCDWLNATQEWCDWLCMQLTHKNDVIHSLAQDSRDIWSTSYLLIYLFVVKCRKLFRRENVLLFTWSHFNFWLLGCCVCFLNQVNTQSCINSNSNQNSYILTSSKTSLCLKTEELCYKKKTTLKQHNFKNWAKKKRNQSKETQDFSWLIIMIMVISMGSLGELLRRQQM